MQLSDFLTLSLLRVINFKFPLQPQQKYYITQYGELGFYSLLRWKMIILPILPTSIIHFLSNRLGECTFWSQDWKVQPFHSQIQKSTFSQPFKEKIYKWSNEKWQYNHLSSELAMKSQVLHTVWCYVSGEAAGEIWNRSLFGVKRLVYTYDASISTSISHVWAGTTQAQEKGTRACACVVPVHTWLMLVLMLASYV